MKINKIIPGYVIQVFDTDTQQFDSQDFTASEQTDYELAEDGTAINEVDFEARVIGKLPHLPLLMVQPDSAVSIEHGDEFIMPDPVPALGDEWQSGNWTGKVVGFREDTNGEKLVTVEDGDGDAFDIERHRLATCERA